MAEVRPRSSYQLLRAGKFGNCSQSVFTVLTEGERYVWLHLEAFLCATKLESYRKYLNSRTLGITVICLVYDVHFSVARSLARLYSELSQGALYDAVLKSGAISQ